MSGRLVLLCGLLIAVVCSAKILNRKNANDDLKFMQKDETEKMIICTITTDSITLTDTDKFMPENIDVNLCTHILYTHATIDNGVILPGNTNDESTHGKTGIYEKINNLKMKNPELKTILSIGGAKQNLVELTNVLKSITTRKTFIDHTINFLKNNNFDGINIDWECLDEVPNTEEETDTELNDCTMLDKEKITMLMKELTKAIKKEETTTENTKLLLTTSIPVKKELIDNNFDILELCNFVDLMLMKTFDMNEIDEKTATIHSPLKANPMEKGEKATRNQEWVIRYMKLKGIPENKLILGLAFYGRSFTLKNSHENHVGAKVTGLGLEGDMTNEPGLLSYSEICVNIKNGWKKVYEPIQKGFYAFRGNQWVGFDDVRSIKEKAEFIKEKHLAGVLVVSLDLDDFTGNFCNEGKFPLLNKINEVIGSTN